MPTPPSTPVTTRRRTVATTQASNSKTAAPRRRGMKAKNCASSRLSGSLMAANSSAWKKPISTNSMISQKTAVPTPLSAPTPVAPRARARRLSRVVRRSSPRTTPYKILATM
jgi:hypothetical protein